MIEALMLVWLVNKVITLADDRGRSWKPLAALLVVLWFVCEIPVLVLLLGNGTGTVAAVAGGLLAGALGASLPLALAARPAAQRSGPA